MLRSRTLRVGLAALPIVLAACGALIPSSVPQIPVGVPAFPDSAGSLDPSSPEGITDVLEALRPAASAEALLTAAAHRVAELRPDEEVRFGWFVAPTGESARAWIQITGTPDDSIAGEEISLEMEGVGGAWRISFVESAIHCRRGVDVASQLCV
jgi:hypothetical protein